MSPIPLMAATPRATHEETARGVSGASESDGEQPAAGHAPVPIDPAGKISRLEWGIAAVALLVLLVFRWFYVRSDIWNSDEPQHLHVVWSWANGYIPYKDFFDNHTPLFHILSVPLFHALGERPDIVIPMRLAMIPLFLGSLWCVYRIGSTVFSPRAGLWSAVLLGFFQPYFFLMGQYRTDVLWTFLWLASLTVLTGGPLTWKRLFFTGLLVGATFGVSMKTVLLLASMLFAAAVTGIAWWKFARRDRADGATAGEAVAMVGASLIGLIIVPSLILLFFWSKGALAEMRYCIIEHNTLPGQNSMRRNIEHLFASPMSLILLPAMVLAAFSVPLFKTEPRRAAQQIFLILCVGFFCPLLRGFWRMITSQDYAPWFPLLALIAVPAVFLIVKAASRGRADAAWWCSTAVFLAVLAGEVQWTLNHRPIFGRGSEDRIASIAQALTLTKPGEYVMDPKGDLIFRPRPYYFVLETLTKKRLKHGLIDDDFNKRLTVTRTAVVETVYSRMSPDAIRFVQGNYLPVGYLNVLGKNLAVGADGTASFDLAIPERYVIVSKDGAVAGTLDGQPLDGPVYLEAGPHQLKLTSTAKEVALFWARAREKGFSPFDPLPPGHTEGDL